MNKLPTPTFGVNRENHRYEFTYSGDETRDRATYVVTFHHCYANDCDHTPHLTMWTAGKKRSVYPDAVLKQMEQDYRDHEDSEPDDQWCDTHVDYRFARLVGGGSPEDIVSDAVRRWEAIQLLVNPSVTDY